MVGSVNSYLPSKTQIKRHFRGALRDPQIKAARPECSPAHCELSTKDKNFTRIISRRNSTHPALFVPRRVRILECLNQALNMEA